MSPIDHAAVACTQEADQLIRGRTGVVGAPAPHWYCLGREHLFFATESDAHHGELALALPP